ncbi:hypothetical protein J6590_045608 [Homalodisca vitripennis]|nr:hypothetical protein J6590_045608 [Homalodisca vitripennis]
MFHVSCTLHLSRLSRGRHLISQSIERETNEEPLVRSFFRVEMALYINKLQFKWHRKHPNNILLRSVNKVKRASCHRKFTFCAPILHIRLPALLTLPPRRPTN